MKLIIQMTLSLLCIMNAGEMIGQLSPGDLAASHAHLEGLSNCTQCHVIGKKVTDQKCLDCHTEIQSRLDVNRGYHASSEVVGKSCVECHNDHHGRNFEIVRFDANAFDHDLTGYQLEGAHQKQDCRSCHTTEYIVDNEIRKKDFTYLGLDTDCMNCHHDYHQQTLSYDCRSCHEMEAFKPADLFDHDKAAFPLKGQHETIDCASCHEVVTQNNVEFQRFTGIQFNQCTDCHDDAHDGRFGVDCRQCHSEESFQLVGGRSSFDHSRTDFPLEGSHLRVDCRECHTDGMDGKDAFNEFVGAVIDRCITCHEDVHEGKFGIDCASCHDVNGFQQASQTSEFDHDRTDFILEGMHQSVDCRECHTGAMTDPVPFNRCTDCHTDYHNGVFIDNDPAIDCASCHTVDGFSGSTFSIDRHAKTAFPLKGAHIATPCFSCHLDEQEWQFADIGSECVDCHEDIHKGYIDNRFYPEENCTSCHSLNSWEEVTFDHSLTQFNLKGTHLTINCAVCHIDEGEDESLVQEFADLNQDCAGCHNDRHFSQFDISGATDCLKCHGFENWEANKFNHDSTRFILEGEHLNTACAECHQETEQNNETYTLYKIEKLACIDCHQ